MPDPVLVAEAKVAVPPHFARTWFLELQQHPERYVFDSHEGFVFTAGEFGTPGARFQTRERFAGAVRVTLKFELVGVSRNRFTFAVLAPVRGYWGYFELVPIDAGATRLCLAVGSDARARRAVLSSSPVRGAVQAQIQREIDHIAASMMSLYTSAEA